MWLLIIFWGGGEANFCPPCTQAELRLLLLRSCQEQDEEGGDSLVELSSRVLAGLADLDPGLVRSRGLALVAASRAYRRRARRNLKEGTHGVRADVAASHALALQAADCLRHEDVGAATRPPLPHCRRLTRTKAYARAVARSREKLAKKISEATNLDELLGCEMKIDDLELLRLQIEAECRLVHQSAFLQE